MVDQSPLGTPHALLQIGGRKLLIHLCKVNMILYVFMTYTYHIKLTILE